MTDISNPSWSETDASNNQASPKGAPEGMPPSGVNDTIRAMAGATKRFWDRINGTQVAINVGNSYSLNYPAVPTGPGHGEIFTWRVPATNTGPATFDPGVGGAKNIFKQIPGGTGALSSGDLPIGSFVMTAWDSIASQYVVVNTPVVEDFALIATSLQDLETHINNVSIADAAGGGAAGAAVASLDARITSQSALWTSNLNTTSLAFVAADRSVSSVIKLDMNSISSVIQSTFIANDSSVSSVIKSDISSVSSVIKSDISSVSSVIKADIASVSSAIRTGVGNMLAVAYASFIGSNPPSTAGGSPNILSVSRSSTGVYRVRFNPVLDITRGLAVIGNAQQGDVNPIIVTASAVKFVVFDYITAAAVSGGYVSLVVFGNS